MSEMVERVARAIFVTIWNDDPDRFHPAYEHERNLWEKAARAAIEAMREPTEAMLDCGVRQYVDNYPDLVWQDMIDAALAEPTEPREPSTPTNSEAGPTERRSAPGA